MKLNRMQPGTQGHHLVVRVVEKKSDSGGSSKVGCYTLGDETGRILFRAVSKEQCNLLENMMGQVVEVHNAKVILRNEQMHLSIDKFGSISASEMEVDESMPETNFSDRKYKQIDS